MSTYTAPSASTRIGDAELAAWPLPAEWVLDGSPDARGAVIDLGNGIDGQLRASELGRDRVEDARTVLKVGEEIEAKFTGVDRKSRTISLSIKAKEMHEEQEAVQSYRSETSTSSGTSLGDLLKEQIGSDRD